MTRFAMLAIVAFFLCSNARASTITLLEVETGWFTEDGFNFNGINNVVVTDQTSFTSGRGFMTFDVSGLGIVTSAELIVVIDDYPNSTLEMDIRLFDFTSGVDGSLGNSFPLNSPAGIAIHDDLGDGAAYTSTLSFNRLTPGQMIDDQVTITLNQNAVDDINASGGLFTIGFADVGNDDSTDTIRFRASPLYQNQLVVTGVPEPATWATCCVIAVAAIRRRRKNGGGGSEIVRRRLQ